MGKILGLDLGTNSIGWAVVDENRDSFELDEKGVHIFSEGVKLEKGNEKSRAAERTGFRSARRLKFRRKLRKYETMKVLVENKMCPLEMDELEQWRRSENPQTGKKQTFKQYPKSEKFCDWLKTDEATNKNPYCFRDKFSRSKHDWQNNGNIAYELGRAFYHMAQRRGFASNRKDQDGDDHVENLRNDLFDALEGWLELASVGELRDSFEIKLSIHEESDDKKVKSIVRQVRKHFKDRNVPMNEMVQKIENTLKDRKNLGPVKQGIQELSEKIEAAGCETLGQYFFALYKKDRHSIENKIRTLYTDREEHYKAEFEIICSKQELPQTIINDLRKAIFFQRPLKSQKGLVGKCSFESNKPRCPVSHPSFEEYRMWSFINNIKIKTPGDEQLRVLTEQEKKSILPKFYRISKPNFQFEDIADTLLPKGQYAYYRSSDAKEFHYLVNYRSDTTVSGCSTTAALMNVFGRAWDDKEGWKEKLAASWQKRTNKDGSGKSEWDIINDFWHALFQADLIGDKKDLIGKSRQDKLEDFIEINTNLTHEQAIAFSKIKPLKKEYSSLSLNAIHKILPWLKQGLIYSHAVFMANMPKVIDRDIWKDPQSRIELKEGIDQIFANHHIENKIAVVINSQLKNKRVDGENYSQEYEGNYRKKIEKRLKEVFGVKSWQETENRDEIVARTAREFTEQYQKNMGRGTFLKIKRIDAKVIDFLKGQNEYGVVYCTDEKRLDNLYHPSDIDHYQTVPLKEKGQIMMSNGEPMMGLGSPVIPAIKNPMAMRTLHQLRKLVNELIKDGIVDEKTKIRIELARELNDANKRAAIKKYQDERQKQREHYRTMIRELYKQETKRDIEPTDDDVLKFSFWVEQDPVHQPPVTEQEVLKYQLWDEQHHRCIYTGQTIGITDFIGPSPKYDIEHTIPRSVSFDNSQMNKTLCDGNFNKHVKEGKIPAELSNHAEILLRLEPWKNKIDELDKQIQSYKRRSRAATTKEQKDRAIQQRHYLTLHRNYWKGKYDRFTMKEVKAGFKNSQKVDTGIITKYAREYLGSLFKNRSGNPNVYSVNGEMVAAFRKAWGLQESYKDEFGQTHYKKKDRSNHIHHCIDAVTIACMTKEKYDTMAHAWKLEEKQKFNAARKLLAESMPWENFDEDLKKLKNEVLIVHHSKDNVPKPTKKKLRKRGKIQYKDKSKTQPIYQQGDSARGSLHQDTFYGAIKQPKKDNGHILFDENHHLILQKDKKTGEDAINYVVRKKLANLSDSDLKKIVDDRVKEIVINARKEENKLKKEIEALKKQIRKANEEQEKELRGQIRDCQNKIENELYVIPPKEGKTQYTPIRKVRIQARLAEPLKDFKKHRNVSKHVHKQRYYVQNDTNYCLVLYESDDREKRAAEIIKLMDAVQYFKASNNEYRRENSLIESEKKGMKIKGLLRPGTLVLFYEYSPEEIWELDEGDLKNRLYYYRKAGKNGQTTFQFHQEARNDENLKEDYQRKHGNKPPKSLTNGESKIDFNRLPIPKLLLSPINMRMLIEGVDFKITPTGKIEKYE